jgi:hypothetical protein
MESSKRNFSEDGAGPPKKKLKTITDAILNGQKNPVMALNEIKPNLVYEITDKGPDHAKIYSASVTINGKVYNAEDTTKKKAKARVAQMILQCSVQLKDPSVKSDLNLLGNNQDFSQDPSEMVNSSQDFFFDFETAVVNTVKTAPLPSPNLSAESAKTNPVYCLNRVRPGIKIEIIKEEGSPHCMIYTACGNFIYSFLKVYALQNFYSF